MKTYKITLEKPLLEIKIEESPSSPREWENLTTLIHQNKDYLQPDGEDSDDLFSCINEVVERCDYSTSSELIIEKAARLWNLRNPENKVLFFNIFNIYEIGEIFCFITERKAKEIGVEKCDFEKIAQAEFETFKQYFHGEIYQFVLYNENGEIEDSCSGFYSLEEIKDHLPKDWQDEDLEKYLIN